MSAELALPDPRQRSIYISGLCPDLPQSTPRKAEEELFGKIVKGDHPESGSGLGLAFCWLAVEAHGGKIEVASAPGQGSTFAFSLPVAA